MITKLSMENQLFYRKRIRNYLITLVLWMVPLPNALCDELIEPQVSEKSNSANQQKSNDCPEGKCNSEAAELLEIMAKDYNGETPIASIDQLKSMSRAKIIVLNKITAKSEEAILKIGELKFFGNLSVEVHKCLQNVDPYTPNSLMLLTIYDNKVEEDRLTVFHGWIVSSNPSLSTLEHPVYEVISRECVDVIAK